MCVVQPDPLNSVRYLPLLVRHDRTLSAAYGGYRVRILLAAAAAGIGDDGSGKVNANVHSC